MRIMIAHPSPIGKARLQAQVSKLGGAEIARMVAELTAAYDYAEHHKPDCVIMAKELADCPEFELLASLFRILGMGCILLYDADSGGQIALSSDAARHIVWLRVGATDEELATALKKAARPARPHARAVHAVPQKRQFNWNRLILIGSSTGGVDALLQVIRHFPGNCPPTLIVQHTGGGFAQSLIRLLHSGTAANVQQAIEGTMVEPGNIYLAPDDQAHLSLARNGPYRIAMQAKPPVTGHRPSVDALFLSALPHATHVTAALLTGMGRDGAKGITALRGAGARTFGQDEASCVVYGMPRVAMEMGGIEQQVPINKMGQSLLRASTARTCV
ncbi:chemotaxis protein CheB [Loktanella agnita]|uniref:chemotaxis protein CheB n=1 Tax=Loktanella agnita TaxID=287097 RepID=UPI003986DFEC